MAALKGQRHKPNPLSKAPTPKSEQAAYEAALEAADHAAETAKELKVAMVAYHLAKRTAELSQAAAAQREANHGTAKEVWEQAKRDASAKKKSAHNDPIYKAAFAVEKKAALDHENAVWEADEAELAKAKVKQRHTRGRT